MASKTEIYFLRVLRTRSLRSEGHGQSLVWTGFLACRLQHLTESHCESETGRERERISSLLKWPHFCWLRTSSFTTSLNLTYLLRTPSPDTVTWAVRASTYELEEDTVQSRTPNWEVVRVNSGRNSQGLDSILGLFMLTMLSHLSNGLWTLCLVPMKTTEG